MFLSEKTKWYCVFPAGMRKPSPLAPNLLPAVAFFSTASRGFGTSGVVAEVPQFPLLNFLGKVWVKYDNIWQRVATCGKLLGCWMCQNMARCAHLKQYVATCVGFVALLWKPCLSRRRGTAPSKGSGCGSRHPSPSYVHVWRVENTMQPIPLPRSWLRGKCEVAVLLFSEQPSRVHYNVVCPKMLKATLAGNKTWWDSINVHNMQCKYASNNLLSWITIRLQISACFGSLPLLSTYLYDVRVSLSLYTYDVEIGAHPYERLKISVCLHTPSTM